MINARAISSFLRSPPDKVLAGCRACRVKPNCRIVNTSRGAVIDEAALARALSQQRLAGAALDVFEGEPKINPRFLELDNVLLQPHQASGTVETRKAMGRLVRENLEAHFSGRELLTPVI